MTSLSFERSVFINCPFDDTFAPLLQAIAFCVTDLGFFPRLAPENADNSATRLDRIIELIRGSKFGIHDLSRCKSSQAGEYARLNMPFELGLDHACAKFGDQQMAAKSILILEENRYDYQKSLSDIAGWDIQAHDGNVLNVIGIISRWLLKQANAERRGPSRIHGNYLTFQEWYWDREKFHGASEDDIRAYPTIHVIEAMQEWVLAGKPNFLVWYL